MSKKESTEKDIWKAYEEQNRNPDKIKAKKGKIVPGKVIG